MSLRSKDEVVLGEVNHPTMGVTINPPPGSISKPLYDDSTSNCKYNNIVALCHCPTMNKVSTESGMYGTIAEVESAPIEVPLQPWLGSEEEETDAWIGRQTRCVPPSVLEQWRLEARTPMVSHHWTYGLLEHWTPIGDQSFGQDRKRKKGLLSIGRHARFVFTSRPQSVKLKMAEEENV